MEYIKGAPVANLKAYLHSKIELTPAFDPGIDPMLIAILLTEKFTSAKTKDLVIDTSYWIDEGFGYLTEPGVNKEGLAVTHIVGIFPCKMIAFDADGFFNGVPTKRELHFTKGSVIIQFTKANFMDLKAVAPEVEGLANCIMAEINKHGSEMENMMKLTIEERLSILERIYGKDIWQHFSQKQLADYFRITDVYISRLKGR